MEFPTAASEDLLHFQFSRRDVAQVRTVLPLPVELREARGRPDEPKHVAGTNTDFLHIGLFVLHVLVFAIRDIEVTQRRGELTGDYPVDDASGQSPYPVQLELLKRVLRASCDDVRVRGVTGFEYQAPKSANASELGKPAWIRNPRQFGNP